MLKATDHKKADRQVGPHNPARCILCSQTQQYSQGDQQVAEEAEHHRLRKPKGAFRRCASNRSERQLPVHHSQLTGINTACRDKKGPRQIAEIDKKEAARHCARRHAPLINRNAKQTVSSKKLRSGKDHHPQPKRKEEAADQPGDRGVFDGAGGGIHRRASHRDEHPGEDAQREHSKKRKGSLSSARIGIILYDLRR